MTQREQFETAAAALLTESGCTVRSWRTSTSGRAYTEADDWGIEVPRPRGPVSFATFAHEVGHQLLHRESNTQRWLEEVEAWEYALAQFERFALPGVARARRDAAQSLRYAARKASHRMSPTTARALLARMPAWVWRVNDPREAVVDDTHGILLLLAGT